MKEILSEALMKRMAIPFMVLGGGLSAFGLFGFELSSGGGLWLAQWSTGNQYEISIGVALLIYGVILRTDSK